MESSCQDGTAVLKFETHAIDLGISPFDPEYSYSAQVEGGLNYLFANANITDIGVQPAGDPDTDGDGIGVFFSVPEIYNASIVMMAIAASNAPDKVVAVSGSWVDSWTYRQVLQDTVDYLAWAQTDFGYGRGGWNYEPMDNAGDRSDQSNSGYATLGLMYAEADAPEGFELSIPGFVRSELNLWIDYIQNDVDGDPEDGGAGYEDPDGPNILRTGNLIQQMMWVGDTAATSQRLNDAIDYLVRHWYDPNDDPGWRGSPASYQATYTTMKGLELLELLGTNVTEIMGIDWFQDFVDTLVAEQNPDGSWPACIWAGGEQILSTEWALLTLQKTIVPPKEAPDLVISEKHEERVVEGETYTVHYTVKNRGNLAAAEGHDVTLIVDEVEIEHKEVPVALAPGESYSDSFETVVTLSGVADEITVCADMNGEVEELNEDNNCLTNWHPYLPITVTRDLPDYAVVGGTFEVTITFTAPEDEFNAILLSDEADGTYMTVAVETTWCDPHATWAKAMDNTAEYIWGASYDAGTAFTAVYQVAVDPATPEGLYPFSGSLEYYIATAGPYTALIGGDSEVLVTPILITGVTGEVDCSILPGATVELFKESLLIDSDESDEGGNYSLLAREGGDYEVVASKSGFKDETQSISIPGPGEYTLNFRGEHGLVPKAPDGSYVVKCVNHWLYPESPCGLSGSKVVKVVNAWLYPEVAGSVYRLTARTSPEVSVIRDMPSKVKIGDTFDVTVTFSAPEDEFNAILLSDEADGTYMTVAVETTWCSPVADAAKATDNTAEYMWFGPYDAGTNFIAVYQVTVDPSTPEGSYSFNGWLEYYVGGTGPYIEDVSGDSEVVVRSVIPGDANGDGVVDVFDLVKVKRIILGLDPPTPGADANQDGKVDVFDLVKIKRIILGLDL